MTEKEVEDIFFLDSGPLVPKTDTVKAKEVGRIRDFGQENMFSFFLDKQAQLEEQNYLQQGKQRLTSLAQGAGSNFSFLFSADPKSHASQSRFLPQLISPTRSYDPFSKPPAFSLQPAHLTANITGLLPNRPSAGQPQKACEESLDFAEEAIFQRLLMSSTDHLKYKQPSYWEDINNKRRRDAPVKGHGLITPTREAAFLQYMQKHYVSMWTPQPAQVASKQFRKYLDLLLMSVESSLFCLDKANGFFFVTNSGMSSDGVSGTLQSL